MGMMTEREGQQFRERWQLVTEAERQELRSTPVQLKFKQLAALMQSAQALGWETYDEADIEAVRQRWRRLREAFRG